MLRTYFIGQSGNWIGKRCWLVWSYQRCITTWLCTSWIKSSDVSLIHLWNYRYDFLLFTFQCNAVSEENSEWNNHSYLKLFTGLPKAVVRPTAGHSVVLHWSMSNVYGVKPGEVGVFLSWCLRSIYLNAFTSCSQLPGSLILFQIQR